MKVQMVPIDSVKPYVKNPRVNDLAVDAVAKSIREFGFRQPIVVDSDYVIIVGHTRWSAAKTLRFEKVPIHVAEDLTEDQVAAYRIADNKTGELAEWHEEMLAGELAHLQELDFDMSILGFSDDELIKLLSPEGTEGLTDPDAVPEAPSEPITKPGDLWIMGEHRLLCGDSTSQDDIVRLMDGYQANLLLIDPPYNVAYVGKTADALTIDNDKMDDERFREFLVSSFKNADSVMRPGASYYIWHAGLEGYNFLGACKDTGWQVREYLIWTKNISVFGRQDYHWKHEPCLYGWKDGAAHKWYSDRKQTTVLEFDRPSRSKEHPTMKPVALFSYQIGNSTAPQALILDTFLGSGTTIIAAEQLGRKCYGMEISPMYCDVIVKRWEEFTGKKAERTP